MFWLGMVYWQASTWSIIKQLGTATNIEAYIQPLALKKTFESVLREMRRPGELVVSWRDNMVQTAVQRLYSEHDENLQLQNPTV
jgi:hypothetical protein